MNRIGDARAGGEDGLVSWLLQNGLEGATQDALLEGYCPRLTGMGVPLKRVMVAQSGYHPRFGGVGLEWRRNGQVEVIRYARSNVPQAGWLNSPFYHLLNSGLDEFHQSLTGEDDGRFPMFADLRALGATDYFLIAIAGAKFEPGKLSGNGPNQEGVLISFVTDATDGFSDAHLDLIRAGLPYLGLALKSASNCKMAQELLEVYLGKDTGSRVLSGEIERGSLEKIHAVICYFDLTGFTSLTERIPGEDLIAMLNDYFGLAVEVIEWLDFTVIGPAVNLTARLSGMHRSVGHDIIVSESVVRHAGSTGHDLVSLGRYMLRGVSEPQELFTVFEKG